MRSQFETGLCPYCTIDPEINVVLWENDFARCWSVADRFKRTTLAHHLIIAPVRHVRTELDLDCNEVLSLHSAHVFLGKEFDLSAGGIVATRFGDMRNNAGTVPHLHKNIMVPNGTDEEKIPIFKSLSDRAKNQARAKDFALTYEFRKGSML